jgi:hypothetical protein
MITLWIIGYLFALGYFKHNARESRGLHRFAEEVAVFALWPMWLGDDIRDRLDGKSNKGGITDKTEGEE